MKCRVCGKDSKVFPCPRCGFDASQDRELYPTLQNDGRKLSSVNRHHSNWEGNDPRRPRTKVLSWILPLVLGLLLGAGGTLFYFSYPQWFPDKQHDPQYTRTVDGLSWAVEDGVLTISGNGEMANYLQGQSPWYDFRSEVTTIVVEDGVTSIGLWAFSGFDRVAHVRLPDSLTEVGAYAFCQCRSLEYVAFPVRLVRINAGAFMDCSALTGFRLYSQVTSIDNHAFCRCSSLTSVTLPNSVTQLGSSAFSGCSSLTAIILPNGLEELKTETFSNCSSLSTVTFPTCLSVIGPRAFSSCYSLTSVHLPINLNRINHYAFQNCPIQDVFYSGTANQWSALDISTGNESVASATIHYSDA